MKDFLISFASAICALSLVVTLCTLPFLISRKGTVVEENYLYGKIDSLECVIGEMQKMDTLIFRMSKVNAVSIENLEENENLMSDRVKNAELNIRRIDADLDAYD